MTRSHCTAPAEEQTALEESENIRRGLTEHKGADASFFGKVLCKSCTKELLIGGTVPLKTAAVNRSCLLALKKGALTVTSS